MAFATIAYEVAGAIATITLDRPDQLNALDPAMERELLQVWDLIDADDAVRAVVVTGRLADRGRLPDEALEHAGRACASRPSAWPRTSRP